MVVVKVLLGDSIGEPDAVRVFHDNSGKFELTEKKRQISDHEVNLSIA